MYTNTHMDLPVSVDIPPVSTDKNITILRTKAKPFLKWAGGKSQLAKQILALSPQSYSCYFEPFVGGGAILFALNSDRAIIGDINEDLINAYATIKANYLGVFACLVGMKNTVEYFYKVRSADVSKLSSMERAARLIYLNKTCFNGLYRVNQKGQFNTPYGKYTNPKFADLENLAAVSALLQNVEIICGTFEEALSSAATNDFIYLDPPYIPMSKYSDFKRYSKESFYESDHVKLANYFSELHARGCKVMLSNSYTDLSLELYKDWNIHVVEANRMINSKASGRSKVSEIIVTNY